MLAYTAKSVIKNLHQYCSSKVYNVIFKEPYTNTIYSFDISASNITLCVSNNEEKLTYIIKDIEMATLPLKLNPIQINEYSYVQGNEIYEQHTINLRYEAQLFIKVFRVMKDRVFFTLIQDNRYLDCYYIDGKLLYIEETDEEYKVMITDLFEFYKLYKDYQILNLTGLYNKYNFAKFLEEQNNISNFIGKKFHRVRDGFKV